MEILNIVSTIFWFAMAMRGASLFAVVLKTKDMEVDMERDFIVFILSILLLAGLNICIGIYTTLDPALADSSCSNIQRLYFGTSLFQLLLSYCVIQRIKRVGLKQPK